MALRGLLVLELAGLAPVPFCGMLLADAGARVIKVDNASGGALADVSFVRGKESIMLNLKDEIHANAFRRLCSSADVLIDPYRPGVLEKFSLGPDQLSAINPRLIIARLTGYGQTESCMRQRAGHDINYLAMSGVLGALRKGNMPPEPPINLLADFGGGGLMTAFGILMALYEREKHGKGQVVDCSLTEGSAYLSSWLWLSRKMPIWNKTPGHGLLDGGAHFYRSYKTKDDKFLAVGALEPQFYFNLLSGLGLTLDEAPQFGVDTNAMKEKFQAIFLTKTQAEWNEIFKDTDSCVTPVLEWNEVQLSDLHQSCGSFLRHENDTFSPRPAPILSNHVDETISLKEAKKGENTLSVLKEFGVDDSDIAYITSNNVSKL